jgi:ketosteroid isomerase-like protein
MKKSILVVVMSLLALPAFAQADKKSSSDAASSVKQAEERWEAALLKNDSKTVGELVASDYAGVNEEGQYESRSGMLSRMDKNKDKLTSASLSDLKIRVYGSNVATAIGDSVEKGTDKDGKSFNRTYRFIDVWMERDGKWQCIAEQAALVKGR